MKWLGYSVLLGRLRGTEVRFHFSILFSLPITYLLFHPDNLRAGLFAFGWLAGFIVCVFLHELGHALAAKIVHVDVRSITIWLLGGLTHLDHLPEKPTHRLLISSAGPLVTLLLAGLFTVAYFASVILISFPDRVTTVLWPPSFTTLSASLGFLNLILFIFNILPIYPLDGGNIFHSLAELVFGKANANWVTMLVSIPVLLCLIALGIFTHDYLLLASCVLIALAVGTLNRSSLRWINLGLNYVFRRAGYFYMREDYDRAAQYYTHDIEREPQQARHYLGRAACYLSMLQKDRSLADVERALKLDPNEKFGLQLRGELYALEKNYDAAMEIYERVQSLYPNWTFSHFDIASVLMDKKEFEKALEEFSRAISLSPQSVLFYVIRSMVQFRLGNLDAAHADQDLAVRLSEKDALTMSDVNMQIYEGYLDWAEDYYARILLQRPSSPYVYQGRADAYRVNGQYDQAIADYIRALEINPREPRLYLARGKCYQAINNMSCAAADFRQVPTLTDRVHLTRQSNQLLKALPGE